MSIESQLVSSIDDTTITIYLQKRSYKAVDDIKLVYRQRVIYRCALMYNINVIDSSI